MPLIYISDCILAISVWYWTPEDINLQWLLFLIHVLCQLVADLRNHRLLRSVILPPIMWLWNPDSILPLWFRSLRICGFLTLFVINPKFCLEFGYDIDHATLLWGIWCWTLEVRILPRIRISLLASVSLALAYRIYSFLAR